MSSNDSGDLNKHRERFNDPILIPSQPVPPPNNSNESPKEDTKKYWYCGCGCGLFILIAIISFLYYAFNLVAEEEANDLRIKYLKQDIERLTTDVPEENFITFLAKTCIDESIYTETVDKDKKTTKSNVINKDKIEYFTRRNENKLLIILKVKDLGDLEPSTRRVFVKALLECFSYVEDDLGIDEYYISLEGFWNTLLVYTPNGSELNGKFADDKLLLPFYNEYVKDSLPSLE
jgi:hypothetical protein